MTKYNSDSSNSNNNNNNNNNTNMRAQGKLIVKKKLNKNKKNKKTSDRRKSVLKMLLVMSEQSPDTCRDVTQDFLTTGRAGRRNALPDILGEHALTSTSDLPERLQCLSTKDEPGKSGEDRSSQMNQNSSQINTGNVGVSHDNMTHSNGSSKS
ncbi:uncharacterized protein LOC142332734 [Lycorma delicatula]|uniref:uncharacterized protein LOC142332734 n=1 Tax=Lycorma delicatula TaxID=130591 RepID=UPI003F51A34C